MVISRLVIQESPVQVMDMVRAIFPKHVADLIQNGHRMVVDSLPSVAVLVINVAGFSRMCGAASMVTVVDEVNRMFCSFDTIMQAHGLEKLDVYGDTYIAHIIPRCAASSWCPLGGVSNGNAIWNWM